MSIEELADTGWDPPDEWTPDLLEYDERKRALREMLVCTAMAEIPRRLGGEATSAQLARDKKVSRRMAHLYEHVVYKRWGGTARATKEELRGNALVREGIRQEAATRTWEEWAEEQQVWIANRKRQIATLGAKREEWRQWANKALHKLTVEQEGIQYALR